MPKFLFFSYICLFLFFSAGAQEKNSYTEVTLPQLLKKLQQKDTNMLVLDVRSPGEFYDTSSRYQQSNIGHIKGAINISVQDFRKNPSIVHRLDAYRNKEIYVICSHSYRSRVVSNILLDSGFSHVNNTRGGMTEFFRRHSEVAPFENEFYETHVKYKNLSSAGLQEELSGNKNTLLISISNTARFFWDSLNLVLDKYYPSFKNAVSYNYADSLAILDLAKKEKGRPIVLFNVVNYGAAELAGWLTAKGIPNVAYLVGGNEAFYEYALNQNVTPNDKFLRMNSKIHFITPASFCNNMAALKDIKIIDLRTDTLFDKTTNGAKYNYKHLKGALNFFQGKGVAEFERQFPVKKTTYIFIDENGFDGLEFANGLANDGYTIHWIDGGLQEWEWYMNNVETFKCMDYLVQ